MDHYYSLNTYCRKTFGEKLYKLALDGGFTCPNRDGTLDTRGCIFCSGGSGSFAASVGDDLSSALLEAELRVCSKTGSSHFIAYFQSYTGTYAPLSRLRSLFTAAIMHPSVSVLSVATRPDCLGDEVIGLLSELNQMKPVWVELGLQTIHPRTAEYIRRCYDLPVYDAAVRRLKAAGIQVIVHSILFLPGETEEDMLATTRYIGASGADGIKFQLLHVLRGTDLAVDYAQGRFVLPEIDEYIRVLGNCVEALPPHMVIHRLTGDGDKRELIAPLWTGNKKAVLNAVRRDFDVRNIQQGRCWHP